MDRSDAHAGPVGLGRHRTVVQGRIIAAGEVVESVYLVQEGQVALERPIDGRDAILVDLVDPGGVFGDVPAFVGEPSLYQATATTRSTLLEIGRDRLGGFLSRDPRLFRWWLRSMACRIFDEQRAVLRRMLGGLTAQVAGLLHERLGDAGELVVAISQRQIARGLGATRQSVSRVLRSLSDQGIVTTAYGAVRVHDRDRLRAAACVAGGLGVCVPGPEPRTIVPGRNPADQVDEPRRALVGSGPVCLGSPPLRSSPPGGSTGPRAVRSRCRWSRCARTRVPLRSQHASGETTMATIEVKPAGNRTFTVTVSEGGTSTTHEVTVPEGYEGRIGVGADLDELVRESFAFLLEREPKESILRSFELPTIQRYFPDYETTIGARTGG